MKDNRDLLMTLLALSILLTAAYTFCMWVGYARTMQKIDAMHQTLEQTN